MHRKLDNDKSYNNFCVKLVGYTDIYFNIVNYNFILTTMKFN